MITSPEMPTERPKIANLLAVGGEQLRLLKPRHPIVAVHIGGAGVGSVCIVPLRSDYDHVAVDGDRVSEQVVYLEVGGHQNLFLGPLHSVVPKDVRVIGRTDDGHIPGDGDRVAMSAIEGLEFCFLQPGHSVVAEDISGAGRLSSLVVEWRADQDHVARDGDRISEAVCCLPIGCKQNLFFPPYDGGPPEAEHVDRARDITRAC